MARSLSIIPTTSLIRCPPTKATATATAAVADRCNDCFSLTLPFKAALDPIEVASRAVAERDHGQPDK